MKYKLVQTLCVAVVALVSIAAKAEIMILPSGAYTVNVSDTSPRRGATEMDVLKKFGEPVHRNRAVGAPAISSWEYLQFEVYFENGLVLHAVLKGI